VDREWGPKARVLNKMIYNRPASKKCPITEVSIIRLLEGRLYENDWIPTKRELKLGLVDDQPRSRMQTRSYAD